MRTWNLVLGLVAAASLAACGDTGNAAGGGIFRVNDITLPDGAFNTTCQQDVFSIIQAQGATVELANIGVGGKVPPELVLESYVIEYIPLDGGPELSPHDYPFEESVLIPANGTTEFGVEFLPVKTKEEYFRLTTGTTNFTAVFFYEARYDFTARSSFGDKVEADGSASFSIGNSYIVECN